MAKLKDIAKLIRSKNAGPFQLTFDIFFDNPEIYRQVKDSGVINKEIITRLYKVRAEDILIRYHNNALAIKISIPRPVISGDIDDTDIYGGQQYAPLIELEIPL